MKIFAVDPGTNESAFVFYDSENEELINFGKLKNKDLLQEIKKLKEEDLFAIEMIKSYGNVMGDSIIQTCVWIGRFIETWGRDYLPIPRKTIVTALCNNPRAKDKNVRQTLIDLFGGEEEIKKGGKLFKVAKDVWSALALAIVAAESFKAQELERLLA